MPRWFLAMALLLAAPAARAQDPTGPIAVGQLLCGALVVDSFYNTVRSDGRRSEVGYMMQLRNTTGQQRDFLVTFTHQGALDALRRSQQRLQARQSLTLQLGREMLANPAGAGALSPQHDVPGLVRITCG